jgi:hypothetical protein
MTCDSLGFSSGTPVSNNKIDCHDITEILLKVALNTINQTIKPNYSTVDDIVTMLFKTTTL